MYAPFPTTCPECGRDAPIVYRGVVPHCTACGALRSPLSGPSINLAGKPSRVGGTLAAIGGFLVLLVGGSVCFGLLLLFSIFHAFWIGLAFGGPVGLVSLLIGVLLVRRGASLRRTGMLTQLETHEQALLGLIAHQGAVTAEDAARALGMVVGEADALLTSMAKRQPERVTLDVDDEGRVRYRITNLSEPLHTRVAEARATGEADAFKPTDDESDEVDGSVEIGSHRRR